MLPDPAAAAAAAARKAKRCFAVARSTTFDGERDAAVARGLGLLKAAGLDPNCFDIPGREREPVSSYQAAPFVAGCMNPTP